MSRTFLSRRASEAWRSLIWCSTPFLPLKRKKGLVAVYPDVIVTQGSETVGMVFLLVLGVADAHKRFLHHPEGDGDHAGLVQLLSAKILY